MRAAILTLVIGLLIGCFVSSLFTGETTYLSEDELTEATLNSAQVDQDLLEEKDLIIEYRVLDADKCGCFKILAEFRREAIDRGIQIIYRYSEYNYANRLRVVFWYEINGVPFEFDVW